MVTATAAIEAYVVFTTAVYGLAILVWVVNALVLHHFTSPRNQYKWGAEDVQVRILTVDNEGLVRKTSLKALEHFSDVIVVAEEELPSVPCPVYTVPDNFKSEAVRKGRAVEWARQHIHTDREYVLYIDEDTLIEEFNGLPDYDLVQFREHPSFTGSLLSYLTEVYRIGYQTEQRGFGVLPIPLYMWGGGIAIRRSVEDEISWDFHSITEDTTFAWKAAVTRMRQGRRLTFTVLTQQFSNQSPTSLRSMFQQRRRWVSGSVLHLNILPRRYQAYVLVRLVIWCFSPFLILNGVLIFFFPTALTTSSAFFVVGLAELVMLHVFTIIGVGQYWGENRLVFLAIPLTVPLSIINAVGALWGVIDPVDDFVVTEKRG